ncbi:glycosyltransferase family 8 protein [Embleya sp. NPDC059237]|uniref:glycosyltransferase family 8 protein n=1 Tax=Embleya sp. NPDC059237 TaxID=3346784 RepID=UPI00369F3AEE
MNAATDIPPRKPAPIVCGVDDGYLQPLSALIESIAATHRETIDELRVVVLHHNLSTAGARTLSAQAARLRLAVELRSVARPDGRYRVDGWASDAVYLRLCIGDALPEMENALYLDADTIVLRDLRPLLTRDLAGAPLGAVRDPQNPLLGQGIGIPGWSDLGLPGDREYFNSGVMLIDLAECRRRDLFVQAARFLVDHPECAHFWDQDALNWAAADSWARLDRRWNTFALSPLASRADFVHYAEPIMPLATLLKDETTASVLHFAGPDKPWTETYPGGELLDAYRNLMASARRGAQS